MSGGNDDFLQTKVYQYGIFTKILFWSFIILLPSVLIVLALVSA